MDKTLKDTLKNAILESCGILQSVIGKFPRRKVFWQRKEKGSWASDVVLEYDGQAAIDSQFSTIKDHSKKLDELLAEQFKLTNGMAGVAGLGAVNVGFIPSQILRGILNVIWKRYKTFQPTFEQVEQIIAEFDEFLTNDKVPIRYSALLRNFDMDADKFMLTDDLSIRRLSDEEITDMIDIESRSFFTMSGQGRDMFHEFVLEGEVNSPKAGSGIAPINYNQILDKAIIALRSFKEGTVGYNHIDIRPVKYCPVPSFSSGNANNFIPWGSYVITKDEIPALQEHVKRVFSCNQEILDMALSRLSDACVRVNHRDQILDCVIGLETILLAPIGNRGELNFRFALNYSSLFDTPEERFIKFQIAKDLYALRNTIAHGSVIAADKIIDFGEKKIRIHEIATQAMEILRFTIRYFLKNGNEKLYNDPKFWERAYFRYEPAKLPAA